VDWWFTLHQPATIKIIGESTIAPVMKWPLFAMILGFYLLFAVALLLRTQAEMLQRERKTRWVKDLVAANAGGK
jgi:heme exporter protein C